MIRGIIVTSALLISSNIYGNISDFTHKKAIKIITTSNRQINPETTSGPIPDFYIDLRDSIPDYFQRDKAFGGFPLNGVSYCGPVAVSNSLLWLAYHGYPNLITDSGGSKKNQYELIRVLGSSSYIDTGPDGSSPSNILQGLKVYLKDHGITQKRIIYNGFRPVPWEFRSERRLPDLSFAKKALVEGESVWLNIGWYKYDTFKDEYTRSGGHWVTLAGYGHDGMKPNSDCLIIHDPETADKTNDYLKLELIQCGKMKGPFKGLPINASGFYKFNAQSGNFGIIDGIAVLEMPWVKKTAQQAYSLQ